MPSNSTCIIAAAGSRKTTFLVEEALRCTEPVLITTYTLENVDQLTSYFVERCGQVPNHVTILPWFTFLLRECARPYQSFLVDIGYIRSINFFDQAAIARQNVPKNNVTGRYFDSAQNAVSRYLSDFICQVNTKSGGLLIRRLERIVGHVFVDEVQDLAGYDLDFLELLLTSSIRVIAVGDPRQATFMTSRAGKNKQFRRDGISDWFETQKQRGNCTLEVKNDCYRSVQSICDFADALFPELPPTRSVVEPAERHCGIFEITTEMVDDYMATHKPVILRYSRATDTLGHKAINIGVSKGKSFDHVLIFPTGPMKKHLRSSGSFNGDRSKFYIAVTRARFSVCFVGDVARQL